MAHAAAVTEISCSFEEGGCWTLAAVAHRLFSEIGNRLECTTKLKTSCMPGRR